MPHKNTMKAASRQHQQQPMVMMRMHRLNRFDAQLSTMGKNRPQRRAALEKRRGMVHDKLVAALEHRIQTLETKLANHNAASQHRAVLEQRLGNVNNLKAMVDMPFEERIRACLEMANPHQRAQLTFWMERPHWMTLGRAERLALIQSKMESASTPEEQKFFAAVLQRMQKHRGGCPGNVEERMLRIQTRLQNTNDAHMRKVLTHRLHKLEQRAGKHVTTPDQVRAKLGARLGAMRGQRCGGSLVDRIHNVETKLGQTMEEGQVKRLTKRLEQLQRRLDNQKQNREKRVVELETQLQGTGDAEQRRKLQHQLDGLKKGVPHRRHRIRHLERRLAACTDPDQKAKIQSRLDALRGGGGAKQAEDATVDMLGDQLQNFVVGGADADTDDDVVIVDPADAVVAMDKSA